MRQRTRQGTRPSPATCPRRALTYTALTICPRHALTYPTYTSSTRVAYHARRGYAGRPLHVLDARRARQCVGRATQVLMAHCARIEVLTRPVQVLGALAYLMVAHDMPRARAAQYVSL